MKAVACRSQAEDSARFVAVALAFYAQRETNLSWPSDRELMAFTHLSRSQLYRALRSLERAGEIHRQPRSEGGPRRTFLVAPDRGAQLAFDLDQRAIRDTFPAQSERVMSAPERATYAGAGKEPPEPPLKTTPLTPQGGNAPSDLASLLDQTGPAPVPDQAPTITSRRLRDVARLKPVVVHEPCPEDCHPVVEQAWAALAERLADRLGSQWEIWGDGAHVHGARDGQLIIAFSPEKVSWVAPRFGPVLRSVAGVPIAVVGCERLAVNA